MLNKSIKVFLVSAVIGLLVIFNHTPAAIAAENGQVLFEQSCTGCHTLDGTGKGFAPDLQGVTEKRDRQWLINWIAEPDKLIQNGDPIAQEILAKYNGVPMPNMGLTLEQSEAIVDYLAGGNQQAVGNSAQNLASDQIDDSSSLTAEKPATETTPNLDSNTVAFRGKALFLGNNRFENKAPACISCHSAGIGALNGGTLGPDLTHVFERYGEMGLSSVLKTLPYPSMQGIYQDKPLTEAEQAALLAFFEQQNAVVNEPAATDNFWTSLTPSWKFVLMALGGCLLLLILSNLTWRDRFTGVRNKLVEKSIQH
jgi:mono/diheme cytochrome c family protein